MASNAPYSPKRYVQGIELQNAVAFRLSISGCDAHCQRSCQLLARACSLQS